MNKKWRLIVFTVIAVKLSVAQIEPIPPIYLPDVMKGKYAGSQQAFPTFTDQFTPSSLPRKKIAFIPGNDIPTCENDLTPPTAMAEDITLQLSLPSGISIVPSDVDSGSFDNCDFELSLNKSFFDCGDIGTQTVILTATDENGNTGTDSFEVTIQAPEPFVEVSQGNTLAAIPAEFTPIDQSILVNMEASIDGALVSIDENFQFGDKLSLTSGFNLPSGLTSNFNSSTGVLTISGIMSTAELQEIFRNIGFSTSNDSSSTRKVTFTTGSGVSNPLNNHYYEYISGSFTWEEARADAGNRTLYGLQGYLATSTSASENDFIRTKLSGDGWLGGSDNYAVINAALGSTTYANQTAAEGNWYWVTGPEAGTQFSINSSSFSDEYVNWNYIEPNNVAGAEHNLQIYFANNGRWNDESDYKRMGYIVEYGGFVDDQSCFSFSGTKSVEVNQPPDISEIFDINNCPSQNHSFSVEINDASDDLEDLEVNISSDNPALLPDDHIHLELNPSGYNIIIDPLDDIQGTTEIMFTVTDSFGASASELFSYTSSDDENPDVQTNDISLILDENGKTSIAVQDINNGSTDNCGIEEMKLDITEFNCSDVGENIMNLIITDVNGNTAEKSAVVTIEDNVAPVPDITVLEDVISECGISNISPPTATDVCAGIITATTEDPIVLTEGDHLIIWKFDDGHGNVATQEQFVFVEDKTAPDVVTQEIEINLGLQKGISISPEDVDGGSSDNCSGLSLSLNRDQFNEVGEYEVILTATDAAGNTAASPALVTVVREIENENDVHVVPSLLEHTSIAKVIVPENAGIQMVQVLETETNNYRFFPGNDSSEMEVNIAPLKGTLLVRIIVLDGTVYLRKLIVL